MGPGDKLVCVRPPNRRYLAVAAGGEVRRPSRLYRGYELVVRWMPVVMIHAQYQKSNARCTVPV